MKTKFLTLFICFFSFQILIAQAVEEPLEVHQVLYYENQDCHDDQRLNKYAIVYQNLDDPGKHVVCYLNSFQGELVSLYFTNQHKTFHAENFAVSDFNSSNIVEVNALVGMENLDDLSRFPESNVKLNYLKKEKLIRNNRMLTAYHFKVKNHKNAKDIIYYIDHASSGVPFSFHKGFYEEMRNENIPLIGNVVQRDELNRNGDTCSYILKSSRAANKKFNVLFQ